jgi:hypothetical protein
MKQMLFALLLIFVPAQAWAGGCSCGSINSMITAAKMETIQAVNAHTAAEAEAIRSEIVLAAQNVIGTIKSESATIIRAIVALKESNVAALKGQGMADESLKTEDMYGKAAQPSGLCGASTLGAGIQLGARAGQELQATMREKQHDYGNTQGVRPVEFLQRVLAEEHPSEQETLEALFPLQGTLTGEQVAQAHESIKTLANPRPLPVVTDAQKKTAAGQTYAAARRIHENRLAAVAEASITMLCCIHPRCRKTWPPGRKISGQKPGEAERLPALWTADFQKSACSSCSRRCASAILTGLRSLPHQQIRACCVSLP